MAMEQIKKQAYESPYTKVAYVKLENPVMSTSVIPEDYNTVNAASQEYGSVMDASDWTVDSWNN